MCALVANSSQIGIQIKQWVSKCQNCSWNIHCSMKVICAPCLTSTFIFGWRSILLSACMVFLTLALSKDRYIQTFHHSLYKTWTRSLWQFFDRWFWSPTMAGTGIEMLSQLNRGKSRARRSSRTITVHPWVCQISHAPNYANPVMTLGVQYVEIS